jgi:pimeloyl-ACP methyl ester carboxylesterase
VDPLRRLAALAGAVRKPRHVVSAPGWPGDAPTVAATREDPDALNDMGIAQMGDHYTELIGTPEIKPVAVGHSFGGLIAQELLANGVVAAAAAIDPAPIKGVKALPYAQLKSAFPVLSNPANLHRTVSLTAKQFHYAFGNTLTEEESDALHAEWTIPGAGLPLFQDASANFFPHSPAKVDTHLAERGPLLLTSRTEDHVVPLKVTKEVFGMYSKGAADTRIPRLRGQGPLLDHRQRLERRRRGHAELACRQRVLTSDNRVSWLVRKRSADQRTLPGPTNPPRGESHPASNPTAWTCGFMVVSGTFATVKSQSELPFLW